MKTRPCILCRTHQMSRKKSNYSVGWTVHYEIMNYKWYFMVLGQYMTITGWYLVSISCYCLVLGGRGSAKGLYACIYWEKWRFGRVTLMPDIHMTTEYSATQLVSSIKFKLRHALVNHNKIIPDICHFFYTGKIFGE